MVRWNRFLEPQLPIFSVFALFYVYVLVMLLTSKQKLVRGSYFAIFIYTGLVDLILFLADQYFRASARLGLGPEFDGIYILAATLTNILFILHVFGNFLATLCQYMAVCWHKYYERFWSARHTIFYLFLLTIATMMPYTPQFWMINKYKQRNDSSFVMSTEEVDMTGFIFTELSVIAYILVATFLVWRTLVSLKSIGIVSRQLKRHYQSLAIITLLDCLFFLIDLVNEIGYLFFFIFDMSIYPAWVEELLGDPFDVYYSTVYISNPIILVIFSRVARREVFRIFLKKVPPIELTQTQTPHGNPPRKASFSTHSRVSSIH